jgi:hypothetical protein
MTIEEAWGRHGPCPLSKFREGGGGGLGNEAPRCAQDPRTLKHTSAQVGKLAIFAVVSLPCRIYLRNIDIIAQTTPRGQFCLRLPSPPPPLSDAPLHINTPNKHRRQSRQTFIHPDARQPIDSFPRILHPPHSTDPPPPPPPPPPVGVVVDMLMHTCDNDMM